VALEALAALPEAWELWVIGDQGVIEATSLAAAIASLTPERMAALGAGGREFRRAGMVGRAMGRAPT
jgi:hypothetical protein